MLRPTIISICGSWVCPVVVLSARVASLECPCWSVRIELRRFLGLVVALWPCPTFLGPGRVSRDEYESAYCRTSLVRESTSSASADFPLRVCLFVRAR